MKIRKEIVDVGVTHAAYKDEDPAFDCQAEGAGVASRRVNDGDLMALRFEAFHAAGKSYEDYIFDEKACGFVLKVIDYCKSPSYRVDEKAVASSAALGIAQCNIRDIASARISFFKRADITPSFPDPVSQPHDCGEVAREVASDIKGLQDLNKVKRKLLIAYVQAGLRLIPESEVALRKEGTDLIAAMKDSRIDSPIRPEALEMMEVEKVIISAHAKNLG